MDWFPFILLLAFIKFSITLANDYPTEPTCKDLLETEICNNMKNEGNCDQLKSNVPKLVCNVGQMTIGMYINI